MVSNKAKKAAQLVLENGGGFIDRDNQTLFATAPGISFEVLKSLARKHQFTIGKTRTGQFISIPTSFKHTSQMFELYDDFLSTYTLFSRNYEELKNVYSTVEAMDENISEVSLILDTYAAEVLSQGFVENPLKLKISNSNAQKFVEKVLYRNKIYQRLPNITRSLAKYGNYGLLLSYPYLEAWMTDQDVHDFRRIDVLEDLVISTVHPSRFRVNTDEFNNPVNYEVESEPSYVNTMRVTAKQEKRIWQPWQFCHFKIYSEDTEPYGKSMLWSMRSAFDQLTTLESLLGISRASKLQRLVFYVPMPNGVSMMDSASFLNEFRAQYLNSIFSDTQAPKAGRKFPGAFSILTLPESSDGKKVTFDTIEANIDLSQTEDVDYFLDKILRNSGLPKGYLVGEDVITTAQTLEAQDLKLRRTLIPLKRALLDGLMCLVENILTHGGYDVNAMEIEIGLNEPIQIPADVIDKYNAICELLKSFRELNPQMTNVNQFQFLIKMGLPADISSLVCSAATINTMSTPDDLTKFLMGQKVKDPGAMIAPDLGESIKYSINSKTYNQENSANIKLLREASEYFKKTTNLNNLLTEDVNVFTSEKSLFNE